MFSLAKIVIGFTISAGVDKRHLERGSFLRPLKQEKLTCMPNRNIGTR